MGGGLSVARRLPREPVLLPHYRLLGGESFTHRERSVVIDSDISVALIQSLSARKPWRGDHPPLRSSIPCANRNWSPPSRTPAVALGGSDPPRTARTGSDAMINSRLVQRPGTHAKRGSQAGVLGGGAGNRTPVLPPIPLSELQRCHTFSIGFRGLSRKMSWLTTLLTWEAEKLS